MRSARGPGGFAAQEEGGVVEKSLLNDGDAERASHEDAGAASLIPQHEDAGEIRSQVFSALADVESLADRRYERLSLRVSRIEKRGSVFGGMSEEMKMNLLLVGLSVAGMVAVAMIQEWAKWRRSQ
jgi:hypothetical protein